MCLLTEENDIPIIIRLHVMFTDEQKEQLTQSLYDLILCLLTDDNNDHPIIIRPDIVFTDGQQH